MQFSSRSKSLKPSPTLAMAARARELIAKGHQVISLTVGEPDWATSQLACDAAKEAIDSGFTKYTAAAGIPELRRKIAMKMSEELGLNFSESEIIVGSGAKFIIYSLLQMLINPDDEVLIPSPYWVSYPAMTELAGGTPKVIDCLQSQNFKLTAAQLKKSISDKSKILILCSPSNPTGVIYSKDELSALAQVIRECPNLTVISDDIYNRLLFKSSDLVAPHILHVAPDLRNQVIPINGASKSLSMTGWRVGWAACPLQLAKLMSDFMSQTTSNVTSISQKAVLKALDSVDEESNKAREILKNRWDYFSRKLNEIPGLKVCDSDGAFYVWLDCSDWLNKKEPKSQQQIKTSKFLADLLLDEAHIATVPGAEFGLEGYLRLSFAASEDDLKTAIKRLQIFEKSLV